MTLLASALVLAACTDDGDSADSQRFRITVENVGVVYDHDASGVFNTPTGETAPGPLFPGGAYEFTVYAAPGQKLSFATMMVQSNDLFYAPDGGGIALHDSDGQPLSGDVTGQIHLWDAGTEVNQEPGTGTDQAPRQMDGDTGDSDMEATVRMATDDFGNLPAVAEVIAVSVTHVAEDQFTVRVENVSDSATLSHTGGTSAVPLAPGVWVVTSTDNPLFTSGAADAGEGLEALAEDGDPSILASILEGRSGLTSPFAPGVWLVSDDDALFVNGSSDAGQGLEALAEDGDPSTLLDHLMATNSGVFNTPEGASDPGPLLPGASYSFEVEAVAGDRLHFATMLVQSNDLFVAPGADGIALFDSQGEALSGDITDQLGLWDAGTEVNQRPGTGIHQPLRQSGGNTGVDEMGAVRPVDDMYTYPAVSQLVRVTVTPLQ